MKKVKDISKVTYYESLAKEAYRRKIPSEAAVYFLKASKLWGILRKFKNQKWCLANYFFNLALSEIEKQNSEKSKFFFNLSKKFFLQIGLRKEALYVTFKMYTTAYTPHNLKSPQNFQAVLDEIELTLEEFEDIKDSLIYLRLKIYKNYLKFLYYKKTNNLEKAKQWLDNTIKLSLKTYKISKNQNDFKVFLFKKHLFWNLKAKLLESEKSFLKAADCYRKSAIILKRLNNERMAIDEMINHYKCLAIAHKYNKAKVELFLNKAIQLAKREGNEKQISYFEALKFDHLSKFEKNLEDRLSLLEKAIALYFKAKETKSANSLKFTFLYLKSKLHINKREYTEALTCLNKAKKYARFVSFPNIIASSKILDCEELFYKGQIAFSNGDFQIASKLFDKWLECRKDISTTRKYQVYKFLKLCCEIFSKKRVKYTDLYRIEEALIKIRNSKISLRLYYVTSLVYAYISLKLNNIINSKLIKDIKTKIIEKMTSESIIEITSESIEDLQSRMEIQQIIEEKDWLLRLPPIFLEKIDHCLYILRNSLPELKYIAYREFLLLIENLLKVIIEFHGQKVFSNEWEHKIPKLIGQNTKEFSKFTFGDLVESLYKLYEKSESEIEIEKETLTKIRDLVKIRNNLSHNIVAHRENFPSSTQFENDVFEVIQSLIAIFPTCIYIHSNERAPIYDAQIIWNLIPKRISFIKESSHQLNTGFYYTDSIKLGFGKPKIGNLYKAKVLSSLIS